MTTAREKLQNPITLARNLHDRTCIETLFPDLIACPESHFMALRSYLHNCPERFFSRSIHTLLLEWLKARDRNQRKELREYLAGMNAELSNAMLFLRQINSEDWHDRALVQGDDYEVIRFIDKVLHPTYLRLVEGVLSAFIRPVAHFTRLDRSKKTEGLDVFNLVQELSTTPMATCVNSYNHTVRNGIGHGGITYRQSSIQYHDKRGNLENLDVRSVIRLCDDMVDTCNGLASAIKVFFVLSSKGGYQWSRELLVEELVEETRSPWWSIDGCIETEVPSGTQLLIYARPNSRRLQNVMWAAIHSVVLAESLAPGYSRYFFSLRTPKAYFGWATFDGRRLRQLRESGATEILEYADAIEKNGFCYIPRPAIPSIFSKLDTLIQSFRYNWPLILQQIRENLRIPRIISRGTQMHRNAWGYVLRGDVVMTGLDSETAAETIRSHKRRIIRSAAKDAKSSISRFDIVRYLPLGYAHVSVYSEDFRRRQLGSFGLGPELVCTIKLQRIRRIKSPDIMGSIIETSGTWRIAWNKAWIESVGHIKAESEDA